MYAPWILLEKWGDTRPEVNTQSLAAVFETRKSLKSTCNATGLCCFHSALVTIILDYKPDCLQEWAQLQGLHCSRWAVCGMCAHGKTTGS